MAGLGHVAVGLAAARTCHTKRRPQVAAVAFWSAMSLLPDLDVIGFSLGVEYGNEWGHRGATHSLAFSIVLGVVVGLVAKRFGHSRLRTALTAIAVLVSHALLDTMTDGGLGCALFWPFDLTRYFAPWRPIPVAPIGLDLLSVAGVMVTLVELVLFAPVLLYALASDRLARTSVGAFVGVWLAASWLWLNEGTREAILGFALREDTRYTAGFSRRHSRLSLRDNRPPKSDGYSVRPFASSGSNRARPHPGG